MAREREILAAGARDGLNLRQTAGRVPRAITTDSPHDCDNWALAGYEGGRARPWCGVQFYREESRPARS